MVTKKKKDDTEEIKAPKKKTTAAAKKPKAVKAEAQDDVLLEKPKVARKAKGDLLTDEADKTKVSAERPVKKSIKERKEQTLLPHQVEELLLPPEPTLRLTQLKSPIGRESYQRKTLIGLGLNKLNRVSLVHETPSIRGMINAVRHLIKVEVISK